MTGIELASVIGGSNAAKAVAQAATSIGTCLTPGTKRDTTSMAARGSWMSLSKSRVA